MHIYTKASTLPIPAGNAPSLPNRDPIAVKTDDANIPIMTIKPHIIKPIIARNFAHFAVSFRYICEEGSICNSKRLVFEESMLFFGFSEKKIRQPNIEVPNKKRGIYFFTFAPESFTSQFQTVFSKLGQIILFVHSAFL